jgi:hypothetical protein
MKTGNLRLKKAAWVLCCIVGSAWFAPVSLVAGALVSFMIIEEVTAWREGDAGEPGHLFFIAVETPDGISMMSWRRLGEFRANQPEARLVPSMPQGSDEIMNYRVAQSDKGVEIRVFKKADFISTSVYRVKDDEIVLVYYSAPSFGGAFCTLMGAIVFALFVRYGARFFQRICARAIHAGQQVNEMTS